MDDCVIKRREVLQEDSNAQRLNGIHPVLERIYRGRGIENVGQLDRRLNCLPDPLLLGGMQQLVQLLADAISEQKKILIVGDFDADGATSCAVAYAGLRLLGFQNVSYLVPNRFEYGYGLTPELVEVAAGQKPDYILTVDSGIACNAGVDRANQLGIGVFITDHHLPGDVLPDALAIVDPNLPNDPFPSGNLAGVGVMFYVIMALRSHLREQGYFEAAGMTQPNLAELLDYVALGTVADVVPLDQLNRALVYQGLERIRRGMAHPGINALISVSGRTAARLSTADLGFAIAPRLNAAGRMDDMSLGIECLLSQDPDAALEMAAALDRLNRERREVEDQMKSEAQQLIQKMKSPGEKDKLPWGLCLFDENWHQGVIGILAARIKEKYHRPVIAFAAESNGNLKGSARSVNGIHIRDVLCDLDAAHPGMITRFGGHAMAAGLSLPESNFDAFQQAFSRHLEKQQQILSQGQVYYSDGELEDAQMDLGFAQLLDISGPWGQNFAEPAFDGEFEVLDLRIVGQNHLKWVLRQTGQKRAIDAIAFNVDRVESWLGCARIRAVYRLAVNEFRGQCSPQLILNYFTAGSI